MNDQRKTTNQLLEDLERERLSNATSTLQAVVDQVLDARRSVPSERSVLTAITGIDAGGKGYFTERLVAALLIFPTKFYSAGGNAPRFAPGSRKLRLAALVIEGHAVVSAGN